MIEWRAVKAVAPEVIWSRYASAVGIERLKETFGKHWPPPEGRPGEEVWCFRDPAESPRPFDPRDHPASWMSLAIDQFNPRVAHMSRGVWPDQHGKGLGKAMLAFAELWCVTKYVYELRIAVHASNRQHLGNVIKDTYWTLDGLIFLPLAFTFSHTFLV